MSMIHKNTWCSKNTPKWEWADLPRMYILDWRKISQLLVCPFQVSHYHGDPQNFLWKILAQCPYNSWPFHHDDQLSPLLLIGQNTRVLTISLYTGRTKCSNWLTWLPVPWLSVVSLYVWRGHTWPHIQTCHQKKRKERVHWNTSSLFDFRGAWIITWHSVKGLCGHVTLSLCSYKLGERRARLKIFCQADLEEWIHYRHHMRVPQHRSYIPTERWLLKACGVAIKSVDRM